MFDIDSLLSDIRSAYVSDPTASSLLSKLSASPPTPLPSRWSFSNDLLFLNDHIYIPDSSDLRLRVLRHKHDHILSGHLRQNKTIDLVRREFDWPGLRGYVRDYCKSCTTCMRSKPQLHKPYGTLQQLPIPPRPWESISMDFIEPLPISDSLDAILVVVDRFSKQAIFIPTVITCTAEQLTHHFLIHVFSKHGVPSHVTCDRGSEFISRFFRSLGEALDMRIHFTSGYYPEADGQTE